MQLVQRYRSLGLSEANQTAKIIELKANDVIYFSKLQTTEEQQIFFGGLEDELGEMLNAHPYLEDAYKSQGRSILAHLKQRYKSAQVENQTFQFQPTTIGVMP